MVAATSWSWTRAKSDNWLRRGEVQASRLSFSFLPAQPSGLSQSSQSAAMHSPVAYSGNTEGIQGTYRGNTGGLQGVYRGITWELRHAPGLLGSCPGILGLRNCGCRSGLGQETQGLAGDVAAEMGALEADHFHGRIGGVPRASQIPAPGRYAEHAAACRDDLVSSFGGAGVEDLRVRQTGGIVQPANGFALGVASWVAAGSHHHAHRRHRAPFQ